MINPFVPNPPFLYPLKTFELRCITKTDRAAIKVTYIIWQFNSFQQYKYNASTKFIVQVIDVSKRLSNENDSNKDRCTK